MRIRGGRQVRSGSALFLALLLSSGLHAQDNCSDAAILNVKGGWKKRPDANMRYGKDQAKIVRYIDSIGKLFLAAYPEPRGIEAGWYRSTGDQNLPGGPSVYTFNSLYFAYFCSSEMHKMMLGTETGTWAYVYVNNIEEIIGRKDWSIRVNGLPIHTLPYKEGHWKGYDIYHPEGKSARVNCIFLVRGGQLPWKQVSQAEYLTALKPFLEDLEKEGPSAEQRAADDQKEIARIQNNADLKPEMKQALINGVHERERSEGQYAATSKLRDAYEEKIRLVDNYLHTASSAQLQSPAVLASNARDLFPGSFSTEDQGGTVLVTANPDYFNKTLPAYLPQCMVLFWKWNKEAAALDFKQKFETDFPVEKLQAMLSPAPGNDTRTSKNQ